MIYFKFNGKNSRDFGITVSSRPFRENANDRLVTEEVEGLDGMLWDYVGKNTYVITLPFYIEGVGNVDKIKGWLQGPGIFERSDVPGKFLKVERQSPIVITYITENLYSAVTTFYVTDPYWYSKDDEWKEPWGANLIKNGWDDFEPYPKTENLFKLNERGLENTVDGVTTFKGNWRPWNERIDCRTNKSFRIAGQWNRLDNSDRQPYWHIVEYGSDGERVKTTNLYFSSENFESDMKTFTVTNECVEMEFHFTTRDSTHLLQFRNMVVVPIDSPAIIKTPLENGLTRIQTWGGNNIVKLFTPQANLQKLTTDYVYIKNLNNKPMSVAKNNPYMREYVEQEEHVSLTGLGVSGRNNNMQLLANSANDNLDFIASDPVIVEGDKAPNWQATEDPAIVNEGTAKAKPLIRIERGNSEEVDVTIGGVRFIYKFEGSSKYVDIDCQSQRVYEGIMDRSKNILIGYKFPELNPGANTVKINKGDAKIKVRRESRWK